MWVVGHGEAVLRGWYVPVLRESVARRLDMVSLRDLVPGCVCATHVFANYLLQSCSKDVPREHLDILFDVSRLRARKAHDQLEKIFRTGFALRNGDRSETF